MRIRGRIEIAPHARGSKSARQHQAFLVTEDGERLRLRRYDGPSMRDDVLEAMAGQTVVADGLLRDRLFIAKTLQTAEAPSRKPDPKARASGKPPSTPGGRAKRTP